MATPTSDTYIVPSGTAVVRCGLGAVLAAPPPSLSLAAYRTGQDWLFTDLQRGTPVQSAGSFNETPVRVGISNGTAFNWGSTLGSTIGPTYTYVDAGAKWAWVNLGGDWINTAGTAQATTLPHASVAANVVTSGSSVYTVDITAGVQTARNTPRWNSYIVRCTGGLRALATQLHATLAPPSILVTYTDSTTAVLACTACVRLMAGTSYTQIGATEALISSSVAMSFEAPTKAVSSAVLTIAVTQHNATPATISWFLANPTKTVPTVVPGIAAGYAKDLGLSANAAVIVAHDYRDGTTLSDWVIPGIVNPVSANWDPSLWNASAADLSRLPTAYGGIPRTTRWSRCNAESGDAIALVASTHAADGFAPLTAGVGALRVHIAKWDGADGSTDSHGFSGWLGADLRIFFPKTVCGLLGDTYTRFYWRYHLPAAKKRIVDKKMYRPSVVSVASYALMGGKFGMGVSHLTERGGNSNIGGGNLGWTNRLGHITATADAPLAGMTPYVHSWDMIGANMALGNVGGMGGALYPDRWYCVEIRCKLNTYNPLGGSPSDGLMEIWLDGVKVASHTGWSYRDGPPLTADGVVPTSFAPFRELGPHTLWLNCFQGGTLGADEERVEFYGPMACSTSYIGPMATLPTISAGSTQTISGNTRQSLDPEGNATQNCNFGGANLMPASVTGRAPWIFPVNATGWANSTAYCGSLFCKDFGPYGSLMQYGGAGHSVGGPLIWMRYDIASATWSLVGKALPTDSLQNYVAGSNPPATRFDHTWGDWIGSSSDWPAGWAQPGFNPPEGCHSRASYVYRPANKAGNTSGQIITTWCPSGAQTGANIRGSHVYDIDTGLWTRTTNLRPGSSPNESKYYEPADLVISAVTEASHFATFVDVLDCATMTWTRKTVAGPGQPYLQYDSTQFICGGLFVVAITSHTTGATEPIELWSMPISSIVSGAGMAWTKLTLTASSWPVAAVPGAGVTTAQMVGWEQYSDGNFYATNRGASPNTLWKLTPPAGDDAAKVSGTWAITTQTLTGEAIASAGSDYSRLRYVPALNAFAWTGESMSGPVQAIRPT